MKASHLYKLVSEGVKPLVKITDLLWEESFGSKGMIARVVFVVDKGHDDLFSAKFDYNEHRDHNLSLDEPDWWIGSSNKKGTALEANVFADKYNLVEEVCFGYDEEITAEIINPNDSSTLSKFLDDFNNGFKGTYVEWLEKHASCLASKEIIENKKYTVIYGDSWIKRTELKDNETIADMLKREDLLERAQFVFEGWPKLEGETNYPKETNYPNYGS